MGAWWRAAANRRGAGALLALSLLLLHSPSSAAPAAHATVFDRAEFVLSDAKIPPGDAAPWQPVALPDEWRRSRPGVSGEGWYRVVVDLPGAPTRAQALELPHVRADAIDIYVNGTLVGRSQDIVAGSSILGALDTPVFLPFPYFLLHAGHNLIHFRMRAAAHPLNVDGLSRVTFGDARPVRKEAAIRSEWGFYAGRSFLAMALGAGLITLFVWFAHRRDRLMFWFAITCLSWSLAGGVWNALRWFPTPFYPALLLYMTYGLVVPAVVLSLRTVDMKWPRFEALLWIFVLAEVTYPYWLDRSNNLLRLGWDIANTALLLVGVGIILYGARRPLRWSVKLEIAALLAMAACMFHEGARFLGWVDLESPVLRPYHVPIMLLAIGLAVFERHWDAMRRLESMNAELERRVAEKGREVATYHAEREQVLRQQALAGERQRILADMHDGLGATLVGLLRYAQSDGIDRQGLELRVKEALQELRIAVDALEPAEGDLATVLGKLRYRLEPLLEPAGIRLVWNVGDLPDVEGLEPSAVFAIQRILLQAFANSLQHSWAREIRLAALADGEVIEIRVEDDGRGFDQAHGSNGFGLSSMRSRAASLGARLGIETRPGGGTVVRLSVPRHLALSAPVAAPAPSAA
jgi:signal transduction histidine kinase